MSKTTPLNETSLSHLSEKISKPSYNRKKISTGIAHIGVGNFHRSHQAYYTDEILKSGINDWGICGIGIKMQDKKMYEALRGQDFLYTLMIRESDGSLNLRIIGAITQYIYAPDTPGDAIEKLSSPEIKIITLTITEGGYNYDPSTGYFLINDPDIRWDLHHPHNPKTVFGYLHQGLKRRKEMNLTALTILSCDNIQHNGNICRKMLLSYLKVADPEVADWTDKNVSFPNCMVDRITPVTTESDIVTLTKKAGIEDKWPVTCEPFIQWIIEDDFPYGRPPWEKGGVQFVSDVTPYEKMKIRLLNAGHTLLGILGSLQGYQTIDKTIRDPLFHSLLRKFMDQEVSPVLDHIIGIDLTEYKASIIHRFSNQYIGDKLSRICSESSAKIPKFLIPTITDNLDQNGKISISVFVVAAWCRYLILAGTPGYRYEVEDSMKDLLRQEAVASITSDPLAFLKIPQIFGNLVNSGRFVKTYITMAELLEKHKIEQILRLVLEN